MSILLRGPRALCPFPSPEIPFCTADALPAPRRPRTETRFSGRLSLEGRVDISGLSNMWWAFILYRLFVMGRDFQFKGWRDVELRAGLAHLYTAPHHWGSLDVQCRESRRLEVHWNTEKDEEGCKQRRKSAVVSAKIWRIYLHRTY